MEVPIGCKLLSDGSIQYFSYQVVQPLENKFLFNNSVRKELWCFSWFMLVCGTLRVEGTRYSWSLENQKWQSSLQTH